MDHGKHQEAARAHTDVIDRFDEICLASPARVAVETGEVQLSYIGLRELSRDLSLQLMCRFGRPDAASTRVIATLSDRSVEMIVWWMAILRAGFGYLPLDPSHPPARLKEVLETAPVAGLLSSGATLDLGLSICAESGVPHLDAGSGQAAIPCHVTDDLDSKREAIVGFSPEWPGYIVCTSGSTGIPKLVVVSRRALSAFALNDSYASLDSSTRLLALASPSFDAATFEIWTPLVRGGAVVLYPPSMISPADLADIVRTHRVNTVFLTTAEFNILIDEAPWSLSGISQILFGGEQASHRHVTRALRELSRVRLIHVYGPTEMTTFSTSMQLNVDAVQERQVPIGFPLEGIAAVVEPTEDGDQRTGELLLAGSSMADGYYGDPALTARRFVTDPDGTRWYRTGDIVRSREDGTLVFVGRSDTQVKVRGFRIELGEVESTLLTLGGVSRAAAAAVLVKDRRLLYAWVVLGEGTVVGERDLRLELMRRLPAFAVPSRLFVVPELPLTTTGKVDRPQLASLVLSDELRIASQSDGHRPAEADDFVARIRLTWEEVVGQDVDINTGFFDAGGDSIAIQALQAKLAGSFGIAIPITDLFEHVTVVKQAALLRRLLKGGSL